MQAYIIAEYRRRQSNQGNQINSDMHPVSTFRDTRFGSPQAKDRRLFSDLSQLMGSPTPTAKAQKLFAETDNNDAGKGKEN